jgi:hypothetical protein
LGLSVIRRPKATGNRQKRAEASTSSFEMIRGACAERLIIMHENNLAPLGLKTHLDLL